MVNKGRKQGARAAVVDADDELSGWLERFPEIREIGLAVYTVAGLESFLRSPQPRFDGRTALDLLDNGEEDRVLGALAADHEGLGY